jgi:hypothetical protein
MATGCCNYFHSSLVGILPIASTDICLILKYIKMRNIYCLLVIGILLSTHSCTTPQKSGSGDLRHVSGIYPHLAYYNNEGECGTGAVVPWADRLWVITYGPHLPLGSSDKLYEITPDLQQIIRPESVGGTPANRMIHKESNQLFIGPYAIDREKGCPVKIVHRHLNFLFRTVPVFTRTFRQRIQIEIDTGVEEECRQYADYEIIFFHLIESLEFDINSQHVRC